MSDRHVLSREASRIIVVVAFVEDRKNVYFSLQKLNESGKATGSRRQRKGQHHPRVRWEIHQTKVSGGRVVELWVWKGSA